MNINEVTIPSRVTASGRIRNKLIKKSYYIAIITIESIRDIFYNQVVDLYTEYSFVKDKNTITITCSKEILRLGKILKYLSSSHKIKSVDYSFVYESKRDLKIPHIFDGTIINGKIINNPGVEAKLKNKGKRRIPKSIRYKPLIEIGDD